MPVWAFEPDGGSEDVVFSSAKLGKVNLLVEALRVEYDKYPVPEGVGARALDRWIEAAGAALAISRLLGRNGGYGIFAAAAPA